MKTLEEYWSDLVRYGREKGLEWNSQQLAHLRAVFYAGAAAAGAVIAKNGGKDDSLKAEIIKFTQEVTDDTDLPTTGP